MHFNVDCVVTIDFRNSFGKMLVIMSGSQIRFTVHVFICLEIKKKTHEMKLHKIKINPSQDISLLGPRLIDSVVLTSLRCWRSKAVNLLGRGVTRGFPNCVSPSPPKKCWGNRGNGGGFLWDKEP